MAKETGIAVMVISVVRMLKRKTRRIMKTIIAPVANGGLDIVYRRIYEFVLTVDYFQLDAVGKIF